MSIEIEINNNRKKQLIQNVETHGAPCLIQETVNV